MKFFPVAGTLILCAFAAEAKDLNENMKNQLAKQAELFQLICPNAQDFISQVNCLNESGALSWFVTCGVFYEDDESSRANCYDNAFKRFVRNATIGK